MGNGTTNVKFGSSDVGTKFILLAAQCRSLYQLGKMLASTIAEIDFHGRNSYCLPLKSSLNTHRAAGMATEPSISSCQRFYDLQLDHHIMNVSNLTTISKA